MGVQEKHGGSFGSHIERGKVEVPKGKKTRAKSTGVSLESGGLGKGDKILVSSQLRKREQQGEERRQR